MTPQLLAAIDPRIVEGVLIGAGVCILIGLTLRRAVRREWAGLVRLPPISAPRFSELDLLFATAIFFLAPSFVQPFFQGVESPPPASAPAEATTQPASSPTDDPSRPVPVTDPAASQPAIQTEGAGGSILPQSLGRLLSIAGLLWLGATRGGGGLRGWGLDAGRLPRQVGRALFCYVCIWPACAGAVFLTHVVMEWAAPGHQLTEHAAIRHLLRGDVPAWSTVLTIIQAIALAPAAEELFFRGVLQTTLAVFLRGHWPAIVVSATLFGAIHYPQIQHIPALVVFSAALGYLYARTGSLTLVILVHVFFNGKTLLFLALFQPAA